MAYTALTDVIVPEIFKDYTQQITQEKSRIISSGAAFRNPQFDALLSSGGILFHQPSWQDLDASADNVSSDTGGDSTPVKIQTSKETQVRLDRNNSWATANLVQANIGSDPLAIVGQRIGTYWAIRLQAAAIATLTGVFADNALAPDTSEHVIDDMTYDIKGSSYIDGTTNFNTNAFITAATTMGDSAPNLSVLMVHSVVFATMRMNNLIDTIPDSQGVPIDTFQGYTVVVDDSMPFTGGVYESWLMGRGMLQIGMGSPANAVETMMKPDAYNGGGEERLYHRVAWIIHPVGYSYIGTAPTGGPSNAATANNLANASSWKRVYPERKQIPLARLITREHA